MTSEQSVREALESRAQQVPSGPMSGPALRLTAVRTRRTRRRVSVFAVAVAAGLVALLVAVPAVVSRGSLPPASSQVDGWPTRGDLAGDAAFLAAARAAWEAAPVYRAELPHQDVRVLLAARTELGRYAMLSGVNALGHRRLAVLSDDPRDHAPYRHRLRLRWDGEFPSGKLVTYFTTRAERTLMLVAAPPDVLSMRWRDDVQRWTGLPEQDGVAATVLDSGRLDFRIRAYRPHGNRITHTARPILSAKVYEPDPALLVRGPGGSQTECHHGHCVTRNGGSITAGPNQQGDLTAAQPASASSWTDMSDQADQLWLNYGSQRRSVVSWGGGPSGSALLPDGTGVYYATQQVNGGPRHAVLYIDKPGWPIGRLYYAKPLSGQPLRALTAIVSTAGVRQLVAVAAEHVSLRYQVGGGAWRPLDLQNHVGTVHLPEGVDPSQVLVEMTYEESVDVRNVDSVGPLPSP